jgi:putative membrane protein
MRTNKELLNKLAGLMSALIILTGFSRAKDPFFYKASQANMVEIRAGELAEEKGGPGVSKIGQQMVTDHTKAESELISVAAHEGLSIDTLLNTRHSQVLTDLGKLAGKSFDSAYIASQFIYHKEAIALFSQESKTGVDSSAKSYAGKYLPKLQMHLEMFEGNNKAMNTSMDSMGRK